MDYKDSIVLIALGTRNLCFLGEVDSGTEANCNSLFCLGRLKFLKETMKILLYSYFLDMGLTVTE